MTASEFAFLALGLVLGVASGAALVEVLRSRPPAPREVRVTVSPGSVPTRSSTLANDPFTPGVEGPAPYGPADRREVDRPVPITVGVLASLASPPRTTGAATAPGWPGSSAGAAPAPPIWQGDSRMADRTPVQGPARRGPPLPRGGGFTSVADGPRGSDGRPLVGIAVRPETDGLFEALRAAQVRAVEVLGVTATVAAADRRGSRAEPEGGAQARGTAVAVLTAVADPEQEGVADRAVAAAAEPPAGEARPAGAIASGPCADLRAIAEDRCAVAARAREGSLVARDALRDAQRTYDDHISRAETAAGIADPRAVREAKEAAQRAFRTARDVAATKQDLETAATAWLSEVNRINAAARDAAAQASREQASARSLVTVIERLSVEADAARISAETAEEACIAARQAVADCEELAARPIPPVEPPAPRPPADRYPEEPPELHALAEAPGDREARILRLLRGDREALLRTVAELAGDDPLQVRRWQLDLTGLVGAINAQAIEAGAIDLPAEHPFWDPFTRSQRRDIVSALASLGYRFDGLGGFADGRVPSQRDLSLAVGYAGLDPMRIRRWPSEHEMPELLKDATVASDEYLAEAAGGLTLGELVALLGPRADGLTDLWNDWGRARPRLLATD